MKTFYLFLFVSIALVGCHKDDSPTEPVVKIHYNLSSYTEIIEPLYNKQWSDGSWQKYGDTVTINGILYVYDITNDGTRYYYSQLGYSAFQNKGESITFFSSPVSGLPQTIAIGESYSYSLNYVYGGYNVSTTITERLTDSNSVGTPFGLFEALHFNDVIKITISNQSQSYNSEEWLAVALGTIKQIETNGNDVMMVSGYVDGKQYGNPPKQLFSGKCVESFNPLEIAKHILLSNHSM